MLKVDGINKSYGKKQVLFDITYEFGAGVYGLLGPNGAGKSTLLQIMTDNLRQNSGHVLYKGNDIRKNKKAYKGALGYVPQIQDMYETFTAFQFLEYLAVLKGIKKGKIPGEIRRALDVVGLREKAGQKLETYSGGMKQRIMIAQALLGEPDVLIFDEPTAGLDPKERIKFRNYISRLSEKTAIILATHVVSDVESIAKEIILLGGGRIQNCGSAEELCRIIEGKVFECCLHSRDLQRLEEAALISNIQEKEGGMLRVRCIGEAEKIRKRTDLELQKVPANLQEVYLDAFAS